MSALIIGDSLLRPVHVELRENPNFKVVLIPGATVESLTERLLSVDNFSSQLWENVKFVWVLVGTNDIGNAFKHNVPFHVGKFADNYQHMLLTILAHKRDVHIVSAGVLPRLCDFELSKPLVNSVNKKLQKVCSRLKVQFSPIVHTFTFHGIPQEPFYKPDRLHLSRRGALVLKKAIQKLFSEFNKSH